MPSAPSRAPPSPHGRAPRVCNGHRARRLQDCEARPLRHPGTCEARRFGGAGLCRRVARTCSGMAVPFFREEPAEHLPFAASVGLDLDGHALAGAQ